MHVAAACPVELVRARRYFPMVNSFVVWPPSSPNEVRPPPVFVAAQLKCMCVEENQPDQPQRLNGNVADRTGEGPDWRVGARPPSRHCMKHSSFREMKDLPRPGRPTITRHRCRWLPQGGGPRPTRPQIHNFGFPDLATAHILLSYNDGEWMGTSSTGQKIRDCSWENCTEISDPGRPMSERTKFASTE